MDGPARHIRRQRRAVVTNDACNVKQTTENGIADRHGEWPSSRAHRRSAPEPGVCLKRNPAHSAFVEMCLNLDDERSRLIPFDDEGFFKPRKFATFEGDIDHCAAYGEDLSSRLR